jgi:hypothetical protein
VASSLSHSLARPSVGQALLPSVIAEYSHQVMCERKGKICMSFERERERFKEREGEEKREKERGRGKRRDCEREREGALIALSGGRDRFTSDSQSHTL